jgi:hypothetical protein
MTDELQAAHQRVGQVLAAAFDANHPAMTDWASIGFALKSARERIAELERALLRTHDETRYGHLIKAEEYIKVIGRAAENAALNPPTADVSNMRQTVQLLKRARENLADATVQETPKDA